MSLSKPIYSLLGVYLEQLFNHPVRTKSVTSGVLAASACYTSQRISGQKKVNQHSVLAYALFGFIFGGSIPHYFYQTMERLLNQDVKFRRFILFLSERVLFAPFYQALSLYSLSRFECNSHKTAVANLKKLYWPLLQANWKYLSLAVFVNMAFVPPMLRTVTMSIVSFIWVVFIARQRRRLQEKAAADAAAASAKDK